jgi:arylsulfatase A-like enzyme
VEHSVPARRASALWLEASRLPLPAEAQGRSLWPLLRAGGGLRADDRWTPRPAISEKHVTTVAAGAPPPRDTESFAIISGGWKLIHNTKRPANQPEFELFEHRKDPLDVHDLALEHPDLVRRLANDLKAWRQQAEAARLKPDSEGAASMSKEDLERLRALGYVQ